MGLGEYFYHKIEQYLIEWRDNPDIPGRLVLDGFDPDILEDTLATVEKHNKIIDSGKNDGIVCLVQDNKSYRKVNRQKSGLSTFVDERNRLGNFFLLACVMDPEPSLEQVSRMIQSRIYELEDLREFTHFMVNKKCSSNLVTEEDIIFIAKLLYYISENWQYKPVFRLKQMERYLNLVLDDYITSDLAINDCGFQAVILRECATKIAGVNLQTFL